MASRNACSYFCRNLKQFFGMECAVMCVTSASVYKVGEGLLLDASLQIPWRGGRGGWPWVRWPSTRTECQNLRVRSSVRRQHKVSRSELCWDFTQRRLVVCYWRFWATYRFHLQGSSSPRKLLGTRRYAIIWGMPSTAYLNVFGIILGLVDS